MGRERVIIADTHVLIWWINEPESLSRAARNAIESADWIGISAISAWEVAMLARRNRIAIDTNVTEWLEDVFAVSSMMRIELSIEIAVTAARLSDPLRDPADCVIVATALHRHAPLVTKDHKIRNAAIVETIW